MSTNAIIQDGKVVNQTATSTSKTSSSSSSSKTASSAIDQQKDQFMSLLVAQMKYQDPLEPTSNTEYISQYATFSSLEQMQNMSKSLALSNATQMAGKTVTVNTTMADGTTKEIQGKVDYVTYENGNAFVNINGSSYSADNVTSVLGGDYAQDQEDADKLMEKIDALSNLDKISLSDEEAINALYDSYDNFSDTAKKFISTDYVTTLNKYKNRVDTLRLNDNIDAFKTAVDALPALEDLTASDADRINTMSQALATLSDSDLDAFPQAYLTKFQSYVTKIQELTEG